MTRESSSSTELPVLLKGCYRSLVSIQPVCLVFFSSHCLTICLEGKADRQDCGFPKFLFFLKRVSYSPLPFPGTWLMEGRGYTLYSVVWQSCNWVSSGAQAEPQLDSMICCDSFHQLVLKPPLLTVQSEAVSCSSPAGKSCGMGGLPKLLSSKHQHRDLVCLCSYGPVIFKCSPQSSLGPLCWLASSLCLM